MKPVGAVEGNAGFSAQDPDGKRTERFQIAPSAFAMENVHDQSRFSTAGGTADDRNFSQRKIHIQIFQIAEVGSAQGNRAFFGGLQNSLQLIKTAPKGVLKSPLEKPSSEMPKKNR